MHNNNNNTNIYIIIMMRIRILITLIIINNILYYIYKYNIIKYNIIFASKKNTTSFHYLAAFFLVVFIVFSSLKSAMSFWVWLYIWFTTVFVGDIPILSQVLNLANPPTLTAPIQLRNLQEHGSNKSGDGKTKPDFESPLKARHQTSFKLKESQ